MNQLNGLETKLAERFRNQNWILHISICQFISQLVNNLAQYCLACPTPQCVLRKYSWRIAQQISFREVKTEDPGGEDLELRGIITTQYCTVRRRKSKYS